VQEIKNLGARVTSNRHTSLPKLRVNQLSIQKLKCEEAREHRDRKHDAVTSLLYFHAKEQDTKMANDKKKRYKCTMKIIRALRIWRAVTVIMPCCLVPAASIFGV
jgi:type II secretory pathway component PulL